MKQIALIEKINFNTIFHAFKEFMHWYGDYLEFERSLVEVAEKYNPIIQKLIDIEKKGKYPPIF
jgi:hypothetical protein